MEKQGQDFRHNAAIQAHRGDIVDGLVRQPGVRIGRDLQQEEIGLLLTLPPCLDQSVGEPPGLDEPGLQRIATRRGRGRQPSRKIESPRC